MNDRVTAHSVVEASRRAKWISGAIVVAYAFLTIMATLYFVAEGDDAAEATNALARLVESDFADYGNGG